MNTPVSFELAKLLKEKGWNNSTLEYYFEDGEFRKNILRDVTGADYGSTYTVEYEELLNNWNDNYLTKKNGNRCFGCKKDKGYFETYSAPTIAEVVMWLYETHGIWIYVQKDYDVKFLGFEGIIEAKNGFVCCDTCKDINPAYEAAIEYTLTNLI